MGVGHDHPTSVGIQYKLKSYILGKHSDVGFYPLHKIEDNLDTHSFVDLNDVHTDELCIRCTKKF